MTTMTPAQAAWIAPRREYIDACIAKIIETDAPRRNYGMFLALQDAMQQHFRAGGSFGLDSLPHEIRAEYEAFHAAQKNAQRRMRRG